MFSTYICFYVCINYSIIKNYIIKSSWVIEEDMDCSELVEIYERDEIARDSGFLTRGTLHSISLPVNNLRREIELKRTRFVEVEEGDVVEEEDGDEESDREIYLENESEGEESTSKRAKY